MARKLAVAVWYLMMGRWTALEEIDERLALKVGKIMTSVGAKGLKTLGKTRQAFREETYGLLKDGRTYQLAPPGKFKFMAKPKTQPRITLAQEYGFQ